MFTKKLLLMTFGTTLVDEILTRLVLAGGYFPKNVL